MNTEKKLIRAKKKKPCGGKKGMREGERKWKEYQEGGKGKR